MLANIHVYMAVSLASASSVEPPVPCVRVRAAGLTEANGLYIQQELPDYVGPMAFWKPHTDLWIYRWHQVRCKAAIGSVLSFGFAAN